MKKLPPEALPDTERTSVEGLFLRARNLIDGLEKHRGDLTTAQDVAHDVGRLLLVVRPGTGEPVLDEKRVAKELIKAAAPKKVTEAVLADVSDVVFEGLYQGQQDPARIIIAPEATRQDALELAIEIDLEREWIRREARARLTRMDREDDGVESLESLLLDHEALAARPAPEPLIDGVLAQSTSALLYGAPGTGKSFTTLAMACSVATGRDWVGRPVSQGPVLIIMAEGDAGASKRLSAWAAQWNQGASVRDLLVLPRSVDMTDTDGDVAELIALNATRDFALIVFDTLNRVAGGAEENSSTAMSAVLGNIERIRRAGTRTTSLVVHHSGKNGDMRGSNALLGNPDTVLSLKGEPAMLELEAVKQKDAAGGVIGHYKLAPVPAHDSLALEGLAPGQGRPSGIQAARIEEALGHFARAFGTTGATRSEYVASLIEWMNLSRSTAQSYIGELLTTHRLTSISSGRGTRLELTHEPTTLPVEPRNTNQKEN